MAIAIKEAGCKMSSVPKNLFTILVICVFCASLASPRPQIETASDGTGLAVATIGAMGSSVVTGMMLASPTTAVVPLLLAGIAFAKGLLIGHLHRPSPHVRSSSPYSAFYHDQASSTLYREDLPTPHHNLQQHHQQPEAQYNVDAGQGLYPSSSHHQDGYLSPNNPVPSQYEIHSTGSSSQDLYDGDHYHYPPTDNHLVFDTYTG